jgi:energy-coupling factor transporter ATP-binding protein EcfA2
VADPIITLDHVTFAYSGANEPALRDLSLSIEEGEYVGIVGRNGAGKTTFALTLNGIVPNMLVGPFEGRIVVDGRDPTVTPVREMAKHVGMVFDNPEFQISQMTVAEEVALGLENLGIEYDEMCRRIVVALEMVGLSGFENRMPLALSGGQQQRLAIASTLAMQPRILVMDEPTSNLDPIGKEEVFEVARRLNRDEGITVLMIEHEVEILAEYAHRIIVVDGGAIVANGRPHEVFAELDLLERIGLRTPQATELAIRLRDDFGVWSGSLPITADEAVSRLAERLTPGVTGGH